MSKFEGGQNGQFPTIFQEDSKVGQWIQSKALSSPLVIVPNMFVCQKSATFYFLVLRKVIIQTNYLVSKMLVFQNKKMIETISLLLWNSSKKTWFIQILPFTLGLFLYGALVLIQLFNSKFGESQINLI